MEIKSVKINYSVGNVFTPSEYYQQTISKLSISADKKMLIIETTDNRRFKVPISGDFDIAHF